MKRRPPINYSKEQLDWVKANATLVIGDLHSQFVKKFPEMDVTGVNLHSLRKRKGWRTGRTGQFQPGHVSRSPFQKGEHAGRKYEFKPGHKPHNSKPIGYETVDADGYVKVCIKQTNPYSGADTMMAFKHRLVWEEVNGPIPKGQLLIFLDGNKLNCDINNLLLIDRALLVRLNQAKYKEAPAELKPLILKVCQLKSKAFSVMKDIEK